MKITWGEIKQRLRPGLLMEAEIEEYSKTHDDDYIVEFPSVREEDVEFFIMFEGNPLAVGYAIAGTGHMAVAATNCQGEWTDCVEEGNGKNNNNL